MAGTGGSSSSNTVQLVCTNSGWKTYCVRGSTFDVEDRYTLTSVVGYGAYGVVCAAFDTVLSRDVAIKHVGHIFEDLIDGRRIWREVLIHRLLQESGCRSVLNLIRVVPPKVGFTEFRDLYIVTDLYDTDLHSMIHRLKRISIGGLQKIMLRVFQCLEDMHLMGIIHRDLKPSNILLSDSPETDNVVVCDLGLARAGLLNLKEPLDLTDYVVTRWYRPPELLLMCRYSFPIDLWAAGCIAAEYVMGRPLFGGRDYVHQMELVFSSIPVTSAEFIEGCSTGALAFMEEVVRKHRDTRPLERLLEALPPEGLDLVKKLLVFEPKERLTAQQALRHPFLSSVAREEPTRNTPIPKLDLSFDLHAEVSEMQLRRYIWSEMTYYQRRDSAEKENGR